MFSCGQSWLDNPEGAPAGRSLDVTQGCFSQAMLTRPGNQFAQAQADMRRGFSGSVRARRSKYAMNGWLVSLSRVAA